MHVASGQAAIRNTRSRAVLAALVPVSMAARRGARERRPSDATAGCISLLILAVCGGLVLFTCPAIAKKPSPEPSPAPLSPPPRPEYEWEAKYAYWRERDPQPFNAWWAAIPAPVDRMSDEEWLPLGRQQKVDLFGQCVKHEAESLAHRVLRYRSPLLSQVRDNVLAELRKRRAKVVVAIFWGRYRYVRILWPYLERNLRRNMGIVDEVVMITKPRDTKDGNIKAAEVLRAAKAKYPGVVRSVPFCDRPYGCAFDEILTDPNAVYIKLDDDIVFVKDGSFEHLVLQSLKNPNYSLYSGLVVNNPHGYGLHVFSGAMPPSTYHHSVTYGKASVPFFDSKFSAGLYYGKNVYATVGIMEHEAFIYNSAKGRLDTYTFDLWNMHQCRCGEPQLGLDLCNSDGMYRWSINAFSWLYNQSSTYHLPVPSFDEPTVGIGWPSDIPPHRVGIVGESLFVHFEYTRQRAGKPNFGLREDILLPWYNAFMKQYIKKPYGTWTGNDTLLDLYERYAWLGGEDRFARWPRKARGPLPPFE